jgi:AraC-like DNA-binding protein
MSKKITSIEEFNRFFHQPTLHPLMAVGNLAQADLSLYDPTDFDMYCVVLMDVDFGELVMGGSRMRYRAGTVFSMRPGQVVSMNLDYSVKPQGWMLAFRPELLEKSGLGRDFYMFRFFQHDLNDALELSDVERGIILNSFANICAELQSPRDYLSNHMLRLGIGQLLSYCKRFFERQFATPDVQKSSLADRLESLLDTYLSSGSAAQMGQPTVAWCAAQFKFSANYFGEMVRREMHITAQEFIQQKIVANAIRLLEGTSMSVNEISEELGFSYPNHFSRMFKHNTRLTPVEWRKQHLQQQASTGHQGQGPKSSSPSSH